MPLRSIPKFLPVKALAGVLGWFVLVEAGVESWYRAHEINTPDPVTWTVNWPTDMPGFTDEPITDRVRDTLRFTEGRSASWRDPENNQWTLYFFHWSPDQNASYFATSHRPEVCLPAVGVKLERELEPIRLQLDGGLEIRLRQYLFTSGGHSIHVFYCLWGDRYSRIEDDRVRERTRGGRFWSVIRGFRHRGQRSIEVVLTGPESPANVRRLVEDTLPKMIRASSD